MYLAVAALTACHDDDGIQPPSVYEPEAENDMFIGDSKIFELTGQADDFLSEEFTLKILAPDGSVITRSGRHQRHNGAARFMMQNGLKDGTYRLLHLEYDRSVNHDLDKLPERFTTAHYGLGTAVTVKGGSISVTDSYNPELGMYGSGTEADPYRIASYDQLERLMIYVNSASTNKKVTPQTYFEQLQPIDMDMASYDCDLRYGWYPIGSDTNLPFRGVYKGNTITNLWCDRGNAPGVGLFGFIHNAVITDLHMEDCIMRGNYATGTVAGAVITAGDDHGKSSIINCSTSGCDVKGSDQSFAIGGIVGAVDMQGSLLLSGCSTHEGKVSGSYNVGGILGGSAIRSVTVIADCENRTPVTGEYGGVGGIAGVCDTLNVTGCTNYAEICGATCYTSDSGQSGVAAGGIAGGTGMSMMASVTNHGKVSGHFGVGGIIGSTRIKGDDKSGYLFNSAVIKGAGNTGEVSGHDGVGGIMGEGQFGCYAVYNTGTVEGNDYVGGIAGNTSLSSPQNAINTGNVSGRNYVAGIIAKTTMGIVAAAQNSGLITATGHHAAGITGLSGNNTIIHYCANNGAVSGTSQVGGIIGEIGDPRHWSAANIADCVVGSLECVMAFLGPAMSVTSMAIHGTAHVAAIGIHITETLVDAALILTDAALVSYGVYEILEAEAEQIEAAIHAGAEGIRSEIDNEISDLRQKCFATQQNPLFNSGTLATYSDYVGKLTEYIGQEGNDEFFNENLNLMRELRAEEMEHQKHVSEIIHEVIGGICIAVSTVAAIGGIVASGGAAAPFIAAGMFGALVGGLNAITKGVGDFQANSAIVSQCINAGAVNASSSPSGGIAGELQDACLIEFCVNTSKVGKYSSPFAGKYHQKAETVHSINVGEIEGSATSAITCCTNGVIYHSGYFSEMERKLFYDQTHCYPMNAEMIGDPTQYHKEWLSNLYQPPVMTTFELPIGPDRIFNIPEGAEGAFPVPCNSRAASETLINW